MFEVGQQVVCIQDDWYVLPEDRPHKRHLPVKGMVYTIRGFVTVTGLHLLFFELRNPTVTYIDGTTECSFAASMFKPVKKTDISSLVALLKTKPRERELVHVDAGSKG